MQDLVKWFEENKLIAVVRSGSNEDAEKMIKAAMSGGFKIFEISMQTPQALKIFETYAKKEDVLFGAGAVHDGEIAQRAINAGAKFLSCNYLDRDVISVAKNNDSFVIQGAMTPTEAVSAFQVGADLIKIFPAKHVGGPAFIKSIRRSLPFLKVVAEGDVSMDDAFDYLRYCVAASLEKAIFDKGLVRSDNWAEITERAKQFTQKIEAPNIAK